MTVVQGVKKAVEVSHAVSERWGMKYSQGDAEKLRYLVQDIEENNVRIAMVGDFSSGKSSLLNALFKRAFLPVELKETTKTWFTISPHAMIDKEFIQLPDGSRKPLDDIPSVNTETNQKIEIHLQTDVVPSGFHFMDTPGLSSTVFQHLDIAAEALSRADAVMLVIDAKQTITERALSFLKAANYLSLATYVIMNKAELLENASEMDKVLRHNLEACSALKPRKGIITSTFSDPPGVAEFRELIEHEILQHAERIKTEASIARAEQLCSSLRAKLNEYRSTISLDLSEIDSNLKDLRKQREQILRDMETSIDRHGREIRGRIRKAIDSFHGRAMGLVESKLDQVARSNDPSIFTSALEQAWEQEGESLAQDIRSRLETLQADFSVALGDVRIKKPLFINYIAWAAMALLIIMPTPAGMIIEALLGRLVGKEIAERVARSIYQQALRASVDQYAKQIRDSLDERTDVLMQDINAVVREQTIPSLTEKEDLISSFMEKRQKQTVTVEQERAALDKDILLLEDVLTGLDNLEPA